ncbi:MAG: sulfur carrier protein ThiS [Deltaproteobacteria bacterium]|nr:sulfur carrier protein ThiS [Deltaproteobacteria bacterium]
MKIDLNGKKVKSVSKTLMDLVIEKDLDPNSLIAEVNFEVIRQDTWKDVSIKDGDNIELLSFVGGG